MRQIKSRTKNQDNFAVKYFLWKQLSRKLLKKPARRDGFFGRNILARSSILAKSFFELRIGRLPIICKNKFRLAGAQQ